MPNKPFHLYKRTPIKKGKFIYYVQFYDKAGNRMTAMTTGQTSKVAAEIWAIERLKKE